MPEITQLYVYPVKSMHGVSLDLAGLTVRGLKYDRNWMLTDEDGRFITQRELPKLASITVSMTGESLLLTDKSGNSCSVPLAERPRREISTEVWGAPCKAMYEGDEAAEWLTNLLGTLRGKSLQLVRFKDSFQRKVDQAYLKGEDSHTAFADGFPFLVTSEESLSALNDNLVSTGGHPVAMDRFRPNIVIKGLRPFQENEIETLSTIDGRVQFGLRKPCKRCKVTTVDQDTGEVVDPKEPLRTLTRMKTVPGKHGAFFGQNATLLTGVDEEIKRGDLVEVVAHL